ncbi:hypothetical protein GIS00_24980 [Nakamurella sp. YIM 132087]|uniref:Family 10 glycosylhydrolase n=1 Tax=Nakamurella alba TaxID=2665158 RepID=A0A7K1FVG0_9ACTN|nr:hypothetical protein [Nakamurella alba]MTD17193.1 hypothetical protein [Nakamurella alba]
MTPAVRQEVWAHPVSFATDPDRWAGELASWGATGVRLAHVYHSGRWLLSTTSPGRTVALPSGSWCPDTPGPWPVVDRDLLPRAVEALRAAGLHVIAWTVGLHSGAAVRQRPEWAARNAFGDPLAHALCPAHPGVVGAAADLVAAIAAREVDGIDLEAFAHLGHRHDGTHHKGEDRLRPADRWMLSVCFCRSCESAYSEVGLDPSQVQDHIVRAIGRQLAAPAVSGDTADDLTTALGTGVPALLAAVRAAAVELLLRRVAGAAGGTPLTLRATTDRWHTGGKTPGDPAALSALVGGLTISDLTGAGTLAAEWAAVPAPARATAGLVPGTGRRPDGAATAWYAFDLAPAGALAEALAGQPPSSGRAAPANQS